MVIGLIRSITINRVKRTLLIWVNLHPRSTRPIVENFDTDEELGARWDELVEIDSAVPYPFSLKTEN